MLQLRVRRFQQTIIQIDGCCVPGLEGSATDSFIPQFSGSAVTSQKSKTEVGRVQQQPRVRFGNKNIEFVVRNEAEEPLYPERFPVNSTHRGALVRQQSDTNRWETPAAAAAAGDFGDDDSATMVSRHKSLQKCKTLQLAKKSLEQRVDICLLLPRLFSRFGVEPVDCFLIECCDHQQCRVGCGRGPPGDRGRQPDERF